MKVAVARETFPGEKRVALIPASVPQLAKEGIDVVVEAGAGQAAGFSDQQYEQRGAAVVGDRRQALQADCLVQVHCLGANPQAVPDDLDLLQSGQILIGMCDPLGEPQPIRQAAQRGLTVCALELLPRITRAQTMDVLSSMATIAGYRAVLLAAVELPKMFPMLMTAAGTITPARVFVIGAGVAGLQAIATSRRLGAVVQAYDVRASCREQVESLGAKFVDLQLQPQDAEDQGGYAKELDESFYRGQRESLAQVVAECDVVITTAAIPGKPSPLLVTDQAVRSMAPGSVIVDLAAQRGGNCQLSQPDQRVVDSGVVILGPTNLPSEIPVHASQMFSNNITRFLQNLVQDGQPQWNLEDPIIRDTLVAHQGRVANDVVRSLLGEAGEQPAAGAAGAPENDKQSETPETRRSEPGDAENHD